MVEQFECENCGAYLEFDPRVGGLKCEFCGSTKVVQVEHRTIEEHDFFAAPSSTGWVQLFTSRVAKPSCTA